jgi:hypothetical protein
MAVGAWTFYQKFRRNIGRGAVTLHTGTFKMALLTSASNAATTTLSTYASLTGEVTQANGYSTNGGVKGTMTQTWTAGASAGQYRFNYTPARVWTAGGGNIANVKFAVIYGSAGGHLICFSQLSTAQFNITTGNTLTITASATGVFNLA